MDMEKFLSVTGNIAHTNVNGRISDREERLKVRKLLMGLNDQFWKIRSQILSMETLPYLSKVFSMVSHEESHLQLIGNNSVASQAHAFYYSKAISHFICTQCIQDSVGPSTVTNPRKRPPTPFEPIYYKSGKVVNTKYYYFHYGVFWA